jgi:hypothetical protein
MLVGQAICTYRPLPGRGLLSSITLQQRGWIVHLIANNDRTFHFVHWLRQGPSMKVPSTNSLSTVHTR